ncbi:MAG TPA: ATP-binding protein [Vicinamibacterales bacterium]
MNEEVTVPVAELEALRHRAANVARANAWLRLQNAMLTRLSSGSGLENVVDTIVTVLMETIGGSNLVVYYTMEGRWHARDVFGTVREMEAPDDPLVVRAVQEGALVRSEPVRTSSPVGDIQSSTWVYPLVVQQRVIGAVAMEGMQLTDASIERELQPFFVYAALMLGNEISSYSQLERAHRELLVAHQTLALETAARREAEELYRILFEQSPDGVVLVDPRTKKFVHFNLAAHEHLGYTREEFATLQVTDIDAVDGADDVERRTELFVTEGFQTFESTHRTRTGHLRHVLVTGKLLTIGGNNLILTILRDVTDSKKMEEDLLRAQKLESVGVLAGGIAHDFNNFLMAILGNIALAGQSLPPRSPAAPLLDECEKACVRARDLTNQLLTFSKGGAPVKVPTRVGALVRESALFASTGSGIRCDFEISDDLWNAKVDRGQISQVVHNLIINAVQAMPTGGVIRVRCDNVPAPADGPATPNFVRIDIEDHGVGIPADHLSKIFDPYFTTKQKGSGLGLASAYSVIGRHDGRIEVESTPGVGTTFHIYLLADAELQPAQAGVDAVVPVRHRRVLVMDDDAMVARVVSRMLAQMGCEVAAARDGTEAIAAYEAAIAAGRRFDLVILDLTVPGGMGGREAVVRLREVDPGVRAVVSSGYSGDATVSDFAAFGFIGVLRKPYNLEDVRRVLAELPS